GHLLPLQRQPIRKHIGRHNRQPQVNLDSRLQVMVMVTAVAVITVMVITEECGKSGFVKLIKTRGGPIEASPCFSI
ncbi:MAG TPA: hypothetical protein DEF89_14740, partial [Desulfosporosinus sp.]|nr:hypothetical protein [Desulfosporosinus sp.]